MSGRGFLLFLPADVHTRGALGRLRGAYSNGRERKKSESGAAQQGRGQGQGRSKKVLPLATVQGGIIWRCCGATRSSLFSKSKCAAVGHRCPRSGGRRGAEARSGGMERRQGRCAPTGRATKRAAPPMHVGRVSGRHTEEVLCGKLDVSILNGICTIRRA